MVEFPIRYPLFPIRYFLSVIRIRLSPVSIRNGTLQKARITEFNANNQIARGIMEIDYNNLLIKLHPEKPCFWEKAEQSLLTEAANIYLPLSNPGGNGKTRQGIICGERDPSRGFSTSSGKAS